MLLAVDLRDPQRLATTWPQQSHGVTTVSHTCVTIGSQRPSRSPRVPAVELPGRAGGDEALVEIAGDRVRSRSRGSPKPPPPGESSSTSSPSRRTMFVNFEADTVP